MGATPGSSVPKEQVTYLGPRPKLQNLAKLKIPRKGSPMKIGNLGKLKLPKKEDGARLKQGVVNDKDKTN